MTYSSLWVIFSTLVVILVAVIWKYSPRFAGNKTYRFKNSGKYKLQYKR